jgi:hypothetical protein
MSWSQKVVIHWQVMKSATPESIWFRHSIDHIELIPRLRGSFECYNENFYTSNWGKDKWMYADRQNCCENSLLYESFWDALKDTIYHVKYHKTFMWENDTFIKFSYPKSLNHMRCDIDLKRNWVTKRDRWGGDGEARVVMASTEGAKLRAGGLGGPPPENVEKLE